MVGGAGPWSHASMVCGTRAWLHSPASTQIPAPLCRAPLGVSSELEEKEEETELTMLGNLTLLWLTWPEECTTFWQGQAELQRHALE